MPRALNVAEDYEKVSFSWTGFVSPWLPKHHALKAKVSGLATFSDTVRSRFGASSSSTFLEADGLVPQFVMRGYRSAQFFGRSMWNTNLEYRFPISRLERTERPAVWTAEQKILKDAGIRLD